MLSYSLHPSPEMNVMFVPFNGLYLTNRDCYYYNNHNYYYYYYNYYHHRHYHYCYY